MQYSKAQNSRWSRLDVFNIPYHIPSSATYTLITGKGNYWSQRHPKIINVQSQRLMLIDM
jgi:hypothetical protein